MVGQIDEQTVTELAVRVAGEGDLDRVLLIHAAHTPEMRGTGPASPLEVRTWKKMQRIAGLAVYLAEIGDLPVGTASFLVMPNLTNRCAPTGFIEAVVVVPNYRRRGVATALLDRILDDAEQEGCDKIQLLSHRRHASDGGHDLYRRAGFEAEADGFRRYLRRSR